MSKQDVLLTPEELDKYFRDRGIILSMGCGDKIFELLKMGNEAQLAKAKQHYGQKGLDRATPRCLLSWEGTFGRGWFYPPNFFENGKDGCHRKICGFETCHNYGKGFNEPDRLFPSIVGTEIVSDKKKLDRPDREKIAQTPIETHKYGGKRYLTLDSIDQILAIFPDEEEIRKQERIIGKVDRIIFDLACYDPELFDPADLIKTTQSVVRQWQILKENK